MIKHLFCDLDGTLIVNHKVSQKDKEAIRKFVKAGGQFHIITGRTLAEIERFITEEDIPAHYKIGNNGCDIVLERKVLLHEEMEKEMLEELQIKIEPFESRAIFFEITSAGNVYYSKMIDNKQFIQYKDDNLKIEPQLFQINFGEQGITKMYVEASEDVVAAFLDMLDSDFNPYISHYGEITNVNVGPKGVSKGSALEYLKAEYQLESFAVIGDGANDIPMFSTTEYSFSFHRAREMVTKHANIHVESVAEAIDFLLNANDLTE